MLVNYIIEFIVSMVATVAFAIVFSAPRSELTYCGFSGAIGWIFYSLINNERIKCVIFSSDYLRYTLKNNLDVILSGKYKDNEFFVKNIFFDTFDVRIDTKYNIEGVKDYIIKDAVLKLLDDFSKEDFLPLELKEKYKLLDYKNYIYNKVKLFK